MQFFKRMAIVVLGLGLVFGLQGLAGSVALSRSFKNPETVKQTIADSGVYAPAADAIVENGIKNADSSTDLPLDDPAVQKAIKEAVPPDLVQQNAEEIIDSLYAWGRGETETPEFSIDAKSIKNQIAKNVSNAGLARVEKLPACTPAQLQKIDPNNTSPFTIPCKPVGVNLQALQKQYEQEIKQSDVFLDDPEITANDIKDDSGQPAFAEAESSSEGLNNIFSLPVIAGLVAVASAVGIVFLRPTKRSGLKVVFVLVLVSAVIIAISAWVSNAFFQALNPNFGEADAAELQEAILQLIRSLSSAVNRVLFVFAGIYGVVGGTGLVALHFTKKPEPAETPKTDSDTPSKLEDTETK